MLRKNSNLLLNNKNNKNTKNKKMLLRRIFLSLVLVLFTITIACTTTINICLNKINKVDINKNDFNINESFSIEENANTNTNISDEWHIVKPKEDMTNIALFGIDETEGLAGRSDCIMILTINNKNKELKLSSIIRDSYVIIPTKSKRDKINHAYAFGGPKLALQTLNQNFNLNIDKFISVNFSSLPKIIDDLDGITLDITDEELKYINSYIDSINEINNTNSPNILTSGFQLVNGTQALAYCRIRYTDGGDFERSQRHRTVLSKLYEKSKTISLTKYPQLLDEILPLIHTNLEKTEIVSLALYLNSLNNKTILQDRFPHDEDGYGKLIDGIYYYVFDQDSTLSKIHKFIFE